MRGACPMELFHVAQIAQDVSRDPQTLTAHPAFEARRAPFAFAEGTFDPMDQGDRSGPPVDRSLAKRLGLVFDDASLPELALSRRGGARVVHL